MSVPPPVDQCQNCGSTTICTHQVMLGTVPGVIVQNTGGQSVITRRQSSRTACPKCNLVHHNERGTQLLCMFHETALDLQIKPDYYDERIWQCVASRIINQIYTKPVKVTKANKATPVTPTPTITLQPGSVIPAQVFPPPTPQLTPAQINTIDNSITITIPEEKSEPLPTTTSIQTDEETVKATKAAMRAAQRAARRAK